MVLSARHSTWLLGSNVFPFFFWRGRCELGTAPLQLRELPSSNLPLMSSAIFLTRGYGVERSVGYRKAPGRERIALLRHLISRSSVILEDTRQMYEVQASSESNLRRRASGRWSPESSRHCKDLLPHSKTFCICK